MKSIDRNGMHGHFLLRHFKSKIMDFTSKRIWTWSITILGFFQYGFQPFSASCIYLKFQEKRLHFIFAAIRSRLSCSDPELQISTDPKVTFNLHSTFGDDSEKHFVAYMLNFILDSMQFLQIRNIQKQIISGSATWKYLKKYIQKDL